MKLTNRTKSALLVFALGVCSLASCNQKKEDKEGAKKNVPKILKAEGIVVHPQQFQSDYTVSGSLLPNEEVQIMPEVSGRVTNISFKEGSVVKKGQILLKVYNEDIKAQIQKLRAQRELQVKIKNRQEELLRIGGISQQDYETTGTQIQSIDADIAYAEAVLRKSTIKAPFQGTIGIRNVSVGAVVTPATIVATLQQAHILKMDFMIPDQYRNEVPNGKEIAFTVPGSLDTFSATISAVEPSANATTRTLKVRALVKNDDHRLGAGSFAHVIIPFQNNKNALLIPSQSVIPTNRDKVVAIVKDGKAKLVPVTIGTRTDKGVEILQGINDGDTVLTTGIMQVKQGMEVKVHIR